jgi:hypothetical protein
MPVLRCTAKLLKRLRQPAKPPEPPPANNPLGEWYADIDFIDREPFVVMLNATTGAGMVLPGRAEDLRCLHLHAGQQLFKLLMHYGFDLDQPRVGAELLAWDEAPSFACTQDRSLLGTLRRVKDEAWFHFAYRDRSLPDAAAHQWEGLFTHPSLPRNPRIRGNSHTPLDLVRARLLPAADVVDLARRRLAKADAGRGH